MMRMQELIKKIKEKRELSGLSNFIIGEALENYIKKNSINLENLKNQDIKIIIKEVRAELRLLSGRYQKSIKDRLKLFEKNNLDELLKTHSSTAERLQDYEIIKDKIKELKVSSVLDMGCGLNPLALASKNIEYFASDIKEDELVLIDLFFKKNNIKGRTFFYDLRKISDNLPKTDLCILFKVLDVLDDKHHSLPEKIILTVPSRYILASFSTKKLSGKPMNKPERIWFEKILFKNNLKFEKFSTHNEVFYLICRELFFCKLPTISS